MANPEHVAIVRQGAAAIAKWRRRNPGLRLDLSGAGFDGLNLLEANLSIANLAGADLSGVNLSDANLTWADLTDANLGGANLTDADLTGADLTSADLSGAYLSGANFTWAFLIGTNLTGAYFDFVFLPDCDLSEATGLAAVNHKGPSIIGVDTLIASCRGAGNRLTPDLESFFLGTGVPKELLAALPQIVGEVEYYSCFISYGQPDVDFAKKLHDDLVARGVSCWVYALDATPGERTWKEIGRERGHADKMVVICSTAALIRDGVLKEIEEQIDDDPEKMVPISRDDIWIQTGFRVMRGSRDLGPFLRDRNYADFSDESCYEDSLQRVLKALRRKTE
jgi:hypothetical protein